MPLPEPDRLRRQDPAGTGPILGDEWGAEVGGAMASVALQAHLDPHLVGLVPDHSPAIRQMTHETKAPTPDPFRGGLRYIQWVEAWAVVRHLDADSLLRDVNRNPDRVSWPEPGVTNGVRHHLACEQPDVLSAVLKCRSLVE